MDPTPKPDEPVSQSLSPKHTGTALLRSEIPRQRGSSDDASATSDYGAATS